MVKKICDAKNNNLKTVEIWGSGKPIREWLYVEDGATALIKSIQLSEGHNFLNVGVKKGVSILDLAYKIKEKVQWNGEFIFDTSRPDGVFEKKVDGTKGEHLLGWSPQVDLDLGIKKTVDWYLNNNAKR